MYEANERNYENLCNMVVQTAAQDYRKALIKLKKCMDEVEELERFFTGDNIKIYTRLDGPTLMNKLKEQVIECHYDMAEIIKQIGGGKEEEES